MAFRSRVLHANMLAFDEPPTGNDAQEEAGRGDRGTRAVLGERCSNVSASKGLFLARTADLFQAVQHQSHHSHHTVHRLSQQHNGYSDRQQSHGPIINPVGVGVRGQLVAIQYPGASDRDFGLRKTKCQPDMCLFLLDKSDRCLCCHRAEECEEQSCHFGSLSPAAWARGNG